MLTHANMLPGHSIPPGTFRAVTSFDTKNAWDLRKPICCSGFRAYLTGLAPLGAYRRGVVPVGVSPRSSVVRFLLLLLVQSYRGCFLSTTGNGYVTVLSRPCDNCFKDISSMRLSASPRTCPTVTSPVIDVAKKHQSVTIDAPETHQTV
jgi:hypothetical protein